MPFIDKDFLYMPKASYAILPNGEPLFLKEIPKELKERFIKDLRDKQKKQLENFDADEYI